MIEQEIKMMDYFKASATGLISNLNQMPVLVILESLLLSYANVPRSYALIVKDERLS